MAHLRSALTELQALVFAKATRDRKIRFLETSLRGLERAATVNDAENIHQRIDHHARLAALYDAAPDGANKASAHRFVIRVLEAECEKRGFAIVTERAA